MELALRGLDHALGFPCDNMTTLGHFIFTGILERFPSCAWRFSSPTPAGCRSGSAAWTIIPMGAIASWANRTNCGMLPSEYFMRQCVISCDSDERALKYVVDDLKGENIVWNTDYPHPDAIEPKRALPDLDAQPIPTTTSAKFSGTTRSNYLDQGF
jgi:hypothetical protein